MLCFRCGSPVKKDHAVCENCGQDLTTERKAAQSEVPSVSTRLERSKGRPQSGDWARAVEFRVGDVIGEKYEITDVLGSGALGTVYKARDPKTENDVALKVIEPIRHNEVLERTGPVGANR